MNWVRARVLKALRARVVNPQNPLGTWFSGPQQYYYFATKRNLLHEIVTHAKRCIWGSQHWSKNSLNNGGQPDALKATSFPHTWGMNNVWKGSGGNQSWIFFHSKAQRSGVWIKNLVPHRANQIYKFWIQARNEPWKHPASGTGAQKSGSEAPFPTLWSIWKCHNGHILVAKERTKLTL
jgi:hypothetical protein